MNVRVLLFAGVGAVVLGTLAASANAAPVGAAGIIVSASDVSNIDTVQYRRCWNCRPYVPPYFYRGTPWSYDPYYYGPLYGYGPGYYGYYYGGDVRAYRGRYRRGHRRW